jgi:hypothetical protein
VTRVTVTNAGRRPVTITNVGIMYLYDMGAIFPENTPRIPCELTEGKYITTLVNASGGSVSYELGASAHDTIELRDGSVLSGDVESVSATEVLVTIGGNVQRFSRSQVKRIGLVPRETSSQSAFSASWLAKSRLAGLPDPDFAVTVP